jgi:CubicO group peptidase (beta-lactamase class C family)
MSITNVLRAIALTCLIPTAAAAQGASDWPEVVRQFDAYVGADKIVGGSILYMRDGKVIAQHNAGYGDRAAKPLEHTAGFQAPSWTYGNDQPWEPFEPTEWTQLVAMMPYQQLAFPPGEKFSYSNPAYVYLGRIIEQLSGDPWGGYVYKNIFVPLGLQHSYFRGTPNTCGRSARTTT